MSNQMSSVMTAVRLAAALAIPTPVFAADVPAKPGDPPPPATEQSAAKPDTSIPEAVTDKLAQDLARLQSEVAAAQQPRNPSAKPFDQVEVTGNRAAVLAGADPKASKEYDAKKGAQLWVLDKASDFYAVANDKGQTGWITTDDVKPTFKIDPRSGMMATGRYDPSTGGAALAGASLTAPPDESTSAMIFRSLTEKAVQFRDSYKDNPYVQVTGFTVHVGIPPAIDLTFSFKTATK